MRGRLFDEYEVELDERSPRLGGSWNGQMDGAAALAWDPDSVRFFYERMLEIDTPVIFDIGANTGSYCLLAKIFPRRCQFVAVEPSPGIYSVLLNNLFLNEINDSVITAEMALSDYQGKAILRTSTIPGESGLATVVRHAFREWTEVEVNVFQLNDFGNVNRLNLIKVDTEGNDGKVLMGGEDLIRKFHPGILMESPRYSEAGDFLKSIGYTHFERVGLDNTWCK